MKTYLLAVAALILFAPAAAAQSTATPVLPGLLTNVGCPPGQTYCYVPYSNTNPLPVSATVSASVAVAPLTSTNLSGTIAVSNTFQSIQVSTSGRNGCTIQNQSASDPMWVFFGPVGSATKAKSFELDTSHGLSISCAVGGLGVLTDQVSITGTAADGFTANFQ